MKRGILAVFVFCALSCSAPDDDSNTGNSAEQNPPPDAHAGNSEVQARPAGALADNSAAQSPPLNETPGDSEAKNPPVDALRYYLNLKKLSMDQMDIGPDGALVNKEKRRIMDESGEQVSLVHSIRLITGGVNQGRQAFLVQESYTQPDAMFPRHDRYMCTLLVFISRGGGWVLENNDMFNESDENGVTRREKSCDDFELAWENGFPVLLSTNGKVRHQGGKYVLEVSESGGS